MSNKRNFWFWAQLIFNGVFSCALLVIASMFWRDEPADSWRHVASLCVLWASVPAGVIFSAITYRFSLVTGIFAHTIGRLDRYTNEHRKFLSSGLVCQKCNEMLIGKWGTAGVNCYDANDKRIPIILARLKGRYFECPKCLHQWPSRQGNHTRTSEVEPSPALTGNP